MKKRVLCLVLALVLLLGLLPALGSPVKAATASQNNIVARADYFYGITWVAKSTVYGWNYNYTFSAGSTYRIPYGQPINSGYYIGYGVTIDNFLSSARTAGSVFYTSRSTYSSTSSVYYATDCSAFVSWCWGIDRKTTYSIPQVSTNLGYCTTSNSYNLQLGDALNSNDVGHVVLVTGLTYNSSGTLTQIEITEQTPPQMKRSYYSPSELGSKYGSYYTIQRYYGSVPASPGGNSSSGTVNNNSKYYPACTAAADTFYGGMAEIGISCDWDLHTRIAAANGITNFTGTVEQNTTLLNLLKSGKLINPDYTGSGNTDSGGSGDTNKYYAACSSSAITFYGGMSEIGITCDWDLHTRIAAANGITNFSGTAEQNNTLLSLLKAGKLINPDYSGSGDSSGSGGTVTSGTNGYERGYKGGMAGTGQYVAFGLDVSSWQGADLNFNRIKNAGYDYVILRAGTTNGKDTCFETYYTNAKAAGLDVGVYYYSYATSVAAVKKDMNDFLSYIKGKKYEYPVYFDYEDATQQALSSSLSQQICLTAMDMLAAEGYLVGMYTGKYFSTQLPISTICAKYEIWIAHYLAVGNGTYNGTYDYTTYGPAYSTQYGMYQFTDSVWVNGYGPYDGDVCYKDYPSIVKTYGFNGYAAEVSGSGNDYIDSSCTFYPSHCQIEVTEAYSIYSEPRSASDVIESAPVGTVYTANGLYANGSGNMWYRVTTASGKTGYIYALRVKHLKNLTSDITISSYNTPTSIKQGSYFLVTGTVASKYNTLSKVGAYVYSGSTTTTGTPATGGNASVTGNKYVLDGSAVDDAASFGDLAPGYYNYVITAEYTSYYATGKTTATKTTETVNLVTKSFTVTDSSGNVPAESYFTKCTFYPSRCTFTTTQDTGIFSEPRTQKTGNTSVKLEDAPSGTTYTSTGLYVNAGGNIFYQVTTSSGENGYIYSGYTEFGKKAYDDIKLSGADLPNGHVAGNVFLVTGTIKSTYNTLDTAKVYIYPGFVTSGTAITGGTAKVSNNKMELEGSTIDHATEFSGLAAGQYTYYIAVTFSSYYAKDPQTLGVASGTRTLKRHYFTVVKSSVDQSSCSHKNSTTVIEAATCTATGTSVVSCSKCGLTEKITTDKTSHAYGAYTTTKEATCTTAGSKEKVCADCGKVYTKEIAATGHSYTSASCTAAAICTVCGANSGEAIGHSYRATITEATCTTDGYTTHTCVNCGDSYKDNYVSASGHSWNEATCTTAMTCTTCGVTSGNALGHNYSTEVVKATCTTDGYTRYSCTTCGYGYTSNTVAASGHKWLEATCVRPVLCDYCGATQGEALGHSYNSVVTAPECLKDGYTTHTCSNCGDTYKDSYITALGHSWSDATCDKPMTCSTCGTTTGSALGHRYKSVITPPECMQDGYTTHTCTTCGDSYKDSYISATGHSWNAATCDKPMTCTTCGTTSGSALGHKYTSVVTAPACTKDGYTTHTCNMCGNSYKDSYVNATGHSWNAATCTTPMTCSTCGTTNGIALGHSYDYGVVTTDPTCTEVGVMTYTCTCGDSYTEQIPSLGHAYEAIVTAPTCESKGYTTYICPCSDSYVADYVDALGHSYDYGVVTTDPTCTEVGVMTYTCTCGDSYTEQIPSLGHAYEAIVTAPTCESKGYTTYICPCSDSYVADYVDALGHSYANGICGACGSKDPNYNPVVAPTITLKTPTLLLEDTIKLNIYYSIDQDIPLEKMGMMTWKEQPSVVDISTADAVYPGATFNTGNGFYGVNTDGIPAQNLGDIIYFCIYAELEDGSIVYGKQVSYSPSTYAYNQLRGNATPEMKALLVAILNYGAAAQNYLGYKTDSLVNADLNASMQALVLPYNSSMVDSINPADSNKVGPYAATGGFAKKYPTVLLDGAFAINYHFNPSYTPDAGITLFYWTEADYNAATSLNPNNATGRITMTGSGEFEGIVEGIAAKDLSDTIYVVAGYRSGGVSYCTGVLPYSIGAFCVSQANTGNELMKPLAQSIAVYGYYAAAYFAL